MLLALVLSSAPTLAAPFDTLAATELRPRTWLYTRAPVTKAKKCPVHSCFEVALEEKAPPLCLAFDEGPSEDPTFLVFPRAVCGMDEWPKDEPLLSVGATTFVVPGNGAVYSMGHTNTLFNVRRKFEVKGAKVREVKQPFLFVGGVRKVARPPTDPDTPLAPIVLRAEKNDGAAPVATLVEGAEVEVLLGEGPMSPWFLVRTSLGLVGWYHSASTSIVPDALGIYFAGD